MLKVKLLVTQNYNDLRLKRLLQKDEVIETTEERARYLLGLGYVTILEIYKFTEGKKNETVDSAEEGEPEVH